MFVDYSARIRLLPSHDLGEPGNTSISKETRGWRFQEVMESWVDKSSDAPSTISLFCSHMATKDCPDQPHPLKGENSHSN